MAAWSLGGCTSASTHTSPLPPLQMAAWSLGRCTSASTHTAATAHSCGGQKSERGPPPYM